MVLKYNKVLKIVNTEFIVVFFFFFFFLAEIIPFTEIVWKAFPVIRNSCHMKKSNFTDSCRNMEESINRL